MTEVPQVPDARSRVGTDDWVASVDERRRRSGITGALRDLGDRLPWQLSFVLAGALGLAFGFGVHSLYLLNVGFVVISFAILALGLNVVVGWAGLLDLGGVVVFFGLGAYAYAWLSSPHFHTHWQAEAAVPVILAAAGIAGIAFGLISWRLQGDYLAISTLFLLEIFNNWSINGDRINFPHFGHVAFTNGPDGIQDIDPYDLFGLRVGSVRGYFFLALASWGLVALALRLVDLSRTGRAWRALREDPLAAEALSIPVRWLKLLAFAFGASIAAFDGTIFAAYQQSVFPTNFTPELLILVYAMVILGGAGSLAGVVIGAVVVEGALEVLRSSTYDGYLFYGLILFGLVFAATRRLRWSWLAVLAAAIGFGFAARAIALAIWPHDVHAHASSGGFVGDLVRHWVIAPKDTFLVSRYLFVALVIAAILVLRLRGIWRQVAAVPTIYLATVVWETVLLDNVAATRLVLLGALLVVMMMARPQGLLGTSRVEIV